MSEILIKKSRISVEKHNCPVCEKIIPVYKKYCSKKCYMVEKSSDQIKCNICGRITIDRDQLVNKPKKYRDIHKWEICFDCVVDLVKNRMKNEKDKT